MRNRKALFATMIFGVLSLSNCSNETQGEALEAFTREDFPIIVNSECFYISECPAVITAINAFNDQVGEEVFRDSYFGETPSQIDVVWYTEDLGDVVAEQTRESDRVLIEINESVRDDYCYVMQQLAFVIDLEVSNDSEPNLLSAVPDCDTRDLYPSDDPDRADHFFDIARDQFEEIYQE